MPEPALTVLGFDYGTRRVGVAVGQTVSKTARPLTTVAPGHWTKISRLLEEWKPAFTVVGDPLQMDGNRTHTTRAARRFARQLAGRYGLQVVLWDERLTSREAATINAADLDATAASLILESWLNRGGAIASAAPDHGREPGRKFQPLSPSSKHGTKRYVM